MVAFKNSSNAIPKSGFLPHWVARSIGCILLSILTAVPVQADEIVQKTIERGVAYLRSLQGGDGRWPHNEIGATALAGLTLLECDVRPDDPAVTGAVQAVRQAVSTT